MICDNCKKGMQQCFLVHLIASLDVKVHVEMNTQLDYNCVSFRVTVIVYGGARGLEKLRVPLYRFCIMCQFVSEEIIIVRNFIIVVKLNGIWLVRFKDR